jgi:NAD(P)-dependent dehydrogenase (short-subunit alcohol dehydrogenase family)
MTTNVQNKIALVTGGSSGIGLSIVQKLLQNEISVIAHYHSHVPDLTHEKLKWVKSDFSQNDEIKMMMKNIINENSRIDYLINAASVSENKLFSEIDMQDIQYIYQVNLFSHITIINEVFSLMKNNDFGKIVTISSIGVKFAGSANSMLYSSSKCALEAVTRSFARQGAPSNILANSIRAGVTDTGFHKDASKNMEKRISLIPLKRMARPGEIADMVYFLLDSTGDFITGQEFAVSGGE